MSRTSAYSLQIGTDSEDADAIMLLSDGALTAILVKLSDQIHGEDRGSWIIEALFGVHNNRLPESFSTPQSAAAWVSDNICSQPFILGDALIQLR